MAHAFDTALAAPSRSIIRASALALLAPLAAPVGYLRAVIPFAGVVRSWTDDDGIEQLIDALGGLAPAVAVALGDGVSSPQGDRFHFTEDIELLVYHASNNMRSLALGRTSIDVVGAASNQADPGIEIAMAHVKELLVGQYLDLSSTVKHVRPDREAELVTRPDLTIWLQTFQVRTSLTINRHRGVTELLESIGWRAIREPGETQQPDPAVKPSTLDALTDLEP